MNMNKRMDNLIERLITEGKKFIEVVAHPYGLMHLIQYDVKSVRLVYDFEYFTFTKSTKTLISIKNLLDIKHNEDVMILARSIYENYLCCRYLQENDSKIDSFLTNPLGLALAHFKIRYNKAERVNEIIDRHNKVKGIIENPSSYKIGSDKKYYHSFYGFLCNFSHCNFGILECYTKPNGLFTYEKVNHDDLARLIAIFVYTKIFESVVTFEGEEFLDDRHEESCVRLVQDSIKLQEAVFDRLILQSQADKGEFYQLQNQKMSQMLKEMKESLKEKLGNVEK